MPTMWNRRKIKDPRSLTLGFSRFKTRQRQKDESGKSSSRFGRGWIWLGKVFVRDVFRRRRRNFVERAFEFYALMDEIICLIRPGNRICCAELLPGRDA